MNSTTRRRYDIPDSAFITKMIEKCIYFEKVHDEFTAQLPVQFPHDFYTNFEKAITSAQSLVDDSYYRDNLLCATNACTVAESDFARAFRVVRFIVEQTFPHEPDIRRQFGFGTAAKRQARKAKQLEFAENVISLTNQYKIPLQENGLTDQMVNRLNDAYEQLVKARQLQTQAKQIRQNQKNARIRAYNHLWELLVLINNAAPIVLGEENPARHVFTLPRRKRKKKSSPEEIHHDESDE